MPSLPARLDDARNIAPESELPKAQPTHLKLAKEAARPSADPAPVSEANFELGFLQQLRHLRATRHSYSPAWLPPASVFSVPPCCVGATVCRRCASCRKGRPRCRNSARPSASLRASVTIEMFMPFALSTLEYSISGNTN